MRKVCLFILMSVFLFAGSSWAIDTTSLEDNIFVISAQITTLGYDDSSTSLLELPLGGEAGYITTIRCDSDNSDDHDLYLFNTDISTWYSNKSDKTQLIYNYASAVTDWVDNDVISFTAPTGSIFLGTYNDDGSATATFNYHIEYELRDLVDKGLVTD